MKAKLLAASLLAILASWAGASAAEQSDSSAPVRHVVVFKFSDDATETQIETVADAFREMSQSIPGILSFEEVFVVDYAPQS